MTTLFHVLLTLLSFVAVWYAAGFLLTVSERIAALAGKGSFIVSFFLLGLLTSLSEISVSLNATLADVPQISVGNLLGATMVLLTLVAPLLAVIGNGVRLEHDFSASDLMLVLLMCGAPAFLVADGTVTRWDGALLLAMYGALTYRLGYSAPVGGKKLESKVLSAILRVSFKDIMIMVGGALVIFFAGGQLVREALYFGDIISVSPALLGLIALSIGTNIPELTIGIRAVIAGNKSAALGDYTGSAAINAPILGMLALVNGNIIVDKVVFSASAVGLAVGLPLFYVFARSKRTLSRTEGFLLLLVYFGFIGWEMIHAR